MGGLAISERERTELDRDGGSFYGWRRGWPLPDRGANPAGVVAIDTSPPVTLLAGLASLDVGEVVRRLDDAHHVFLLRVDEEPAAYGWSATGPAHIGGLALHIHLPPGERYLWDFVTLPAFRGRGLYPLLLQEIVRRQSDEAEWFWIGHEPDNRASRRGILKAGFQLAGQVWRLEDGELGFFGAKGAQVELTHGAARALGLRHLHQLSGERHAPTRHEANGVPEPEASEPRQRDSACGRP